MQGGQSDLFYHFFSTAGGLISFARRPFFETKGLQMVDRHEILKAIQVGVHDAVIHLMDAAGGYPITRSDILEEIKAAIKEAMADHLDEEPEEAA